MSFSLSRDVFIDAHSRENLDEGESRWRPGLNRVDRVFENPVDPDVLTDVARGLGRVFQWKLHGERHLRLSRWPACTVLVTVGVAAHSYRAGAFWEELWNFTRIPTPLRRRAEWGEDFLHSLRIIGLDIFDNTEQSSKKYLCPALMHAGIPTYCLDDFFDLLIEHRRIDPLAPPEEFRAWVAKNPWRLRTLDVPARHFLVSGGTYSLDTVRRCGALLDLLEAGRTRAVWRQAGVPPRFQEPARLALEHNVSGPRLLRDAGGEHLRLDPTTGTFRLLLPAHLGVFGVTMNGARTEPDSDGSSPGETVSLPLPTPSPLLLTLKGRRPREVRIFAEHDRLLVFTEQGEQLNLDRDLPTGALWAVHPEEELQHSDDTSIVHRTELSYGWSGWEASCLELRVGSWIRSGNGPVHRSPGTRSSEPCWSEPESLPGVTDTDGLPVHSAMPTLTLPTGRGRSWTIEVFTRGQPGRGKPLTRQTADPGVTVRPLASLTEPRLGAFDIRITDARGKKRTRPFSLAEGARITHQPRLRTFQNDGLQEARSSITVPEGMKARPANFGLRSGQTHRRAEFSSPEGRLQVLVRAPHLQVRTGAPDGEAWSDRTLEFTPQALGNAGDLIVRVSEESVGLGRPVLLLRDEEGTALQEVRPRARGRRNTRTYPIRQFTETVNTHPHTSMVLRLGTGECPVAVVRPPLLAGHASFEDDVIHLHDAAQIPHMRAAVYSLHAPWRDPLVLPVDGKGQISVEGHPEVGGPQLVLLRAREPGAPSPELAWPSWPSPHHGTLLTCDMPGRPNSTEREEDLLCAFLASGITGRPLHEILTPRNQGRVRKFSPRFLECAPEPARSRAASLRARLAPVTVPAQRQTRRTPDPFSEPPPTLGPPLSSHLVPLIQKGIVSAPPRSSPDPDWLAEAWRSNPVLASLYSRDLIRSAPFDAPSTAEQEVLTTIVRRCGRTAEALLRGQQDALEPPEGVGKRLTFTPQEAERLRTAFAADAEGAVGLVDPKVRDYACRRAYTINHEALVRITTGFHEVWKTAYTVCEATEHGVRAPLTHALDQRRAPWVESTRRAPAFSLALAASARLASRSGPRDCAYLTAKYRRSWAAFARFMPELVAVDIVLAELTLAGAERARNQRVSRT